MVNRNDQDISRTAEKSRIDAFGAISPPPHLVRHDDVISSLADAAENRRARQVSEWERMRRQKLRARV